MDSKEIVECTLHGKRTQMIFGKCVLCQEQELLKLREFVNKVAYFTFRDAVEGNIDFDDLIQEARQIKEV